jgi:hypothetical protein
MTERAHYLALAHEFRDNIPDIFAATDVEKLRVDFLGCAHLRAKSSRDFHLLHDPISSPTELSTCWTNVGYNERRNFNATPLHLLYVEY